MKKVPVRSQKKMMKLVRLGFDMVGCTPSKENPNFVIFFFEETPQLLEALHSN